jgi:hypothetical protein
VAIEVLVASHEQAAAAIAELWLGDRLLGSTRFDDDRRLLLELREGPWELDFGDFHTALERVEELLGWERPGAVRLGG